MNNPLPKIKKLIQRARSFFPSDLPVGMTAYKEWSDSIISAYDFPDNDSVRFALATMILRLDPTDCKKPKRYFALCIHKGMAAQVAAAVMQDLKEKQAEEEQKRKSEESLKQLEAAQPQPPGEGSSDVRQGD